jgi:hypothetical protein
MCELHRMVKDTIVSNLNKTHQLISKHKQEQFIKFAYSNTSDNDIRKTTQPDYMKSKYQPSKRKLSHQYQL